MSDSIAPLAKFCPAGHKVGTKFEAFKCTVKKCGAVKLGEVGERTIDPMADAQLEPGDLELKKKKALVGLKQDLNADDAVQWSQEALKRLLPEAVANIAWNLRYGDKKERETATQRVLSANGMDRREAAQQSSNTIVVNLGGATTNVPWLDRFVSSKTGVTIDAPPPIKLPEGDE